MIVSIERLVDQILRADSPALFLDTCIPLDVIRSARRDERALAGYGGHAVRILRMVESTPPGCMLVIASILPREWQSNVQNVFNDIDRHLKQIQGQSSHFHEACKDLGIDAGPSQTAYAKLGVAERLRELAERLLSHAIQIEEDGQCLLRAHRRVKEGLPPSRSGGEMKDCTIVEEYLEVCRSLKTLDHARNRVFCSSNVKDYCDSQGNLQKNLAVDFAEAGLTFIPKLDRAVYELTRKLTTEIKPSPPAQESTGNSD